MKAKSLFLALALVAMFAGESSARCCNRCRQPFMQRGPVRRVVVATSPWVVLNNMRCRNGVCNAR